jgi:hypothetical protein
MPEFPRDLPHLYLPNQGRSEPFTRSGRGRVHIPVRDREAHANALREALTEALAAAETALAARDPEATTGTAGFYLDFQIAPGGEKEVERLEDRRRHIELVSVHKPEENAPAHATVFVPQQSAQHFLRKVEAYRSEQSRTGKPRHEALVANLEHVSQGLVLSLYTDPVRPLPGPTVKVWWELWLRRERGPAFEQVCQRLDVFLAPEQLRFPERDVRLAYTDQVALARLMTATDALAEIRLASDTPSLFLELPNTEQRAWTLELLERLNQPVPQGIAVCVLDTGMTQTHPLLAPALQPSDVHLHNPTWPAGDSHGHGTKMGGVGLYGDLMSHLAGNGPVTLTHCLESVKMLGGDAAQQHEPKLYGAVTAGCVARAEIAAPARRRAVCLAVTSDIGTMGGRPSSWSAEVDQLCFGGSALRRLVLVSAGNLPERVSAAGYPAANELSPIENPGQAWNAVTVGAFTGKSVITDPAFAGWQPLAPAGELSPTSRTAVAWERAWPNKPDVVLEGGNYATNGEDCDCPDDLGLLTTHHNLSERHFTIFGDTSAATALAGNLAARIWAYMPERWPETIRGLLVHSAEWTLAMKNRWQTANSVQKKIVLLRKYGYGVPDYSRAVLSAANDLTLVIEDHVQPFWKPEGSHTVKTRHMNLHQLPWPLHELEQLGATEVELRVTLSYYIEPNPGERGWVRRHRYASHGLRFEVQRPTENVAEFRRRINEAAYAEEQGSVLPGSGSDRWMLGPRARNSGSLHSDYWRGTAADLAPRSAVAVYPVGGWWKENPAHRRFAETVRYSLLVSIRALNGGVDIYTPVLTQIESRIEMEV